MGLFRKRDNKKKTIHQKQEETRAWLAKALIITLMGTISLNFIFIGAMIGLEVVKKDFENQDLREIIILIWTSETALLGTALGFYFGNKSSDNS